ncbi:MAG: hypothetical protein AAF628_32010 [Planctomycetota bacterium]
MSQAKMWLCATALLSSSVAAQNFKECVELANAMKTLVQIDEDFETRTVEDVFTKEASFLRMMEGKGSSFGIDAVFATEGGPVPVSARGGRENKSEQQEAFERISAAYRSADDEGRIQIVKSFLSPDAVRVVEECLKHGAKGIRHYVVRTDRWLILNIGYSQYGDENPMVISIDAEERRTRGLEEGQVLGGSDVALWVEAPRSQDVSVIVTLNDTRQISVESPGTAGNGSGEEARGAQRALAVGAFWALASAMNVRGEPGRDNSVEIVECRDGTGEELLASMARPASEDFEEGSEPGTHFLTQLARLQKFQSGKVLLRNAKELFSGGSLFITYNLKSVEGRDGKTVFFADVVFKHSTGNSLELRDICLEASYNAISDHVSAGEDKFERKDAWALAEWAFGPRVGYQEFLVRAREAFPSGPDATKWGDHPWDSMIEVLRRIAPAAEPR